MVNTIPLRRMVLFKHGIAFYTRQGVVEGTSLELPFRSNEVDDALKSMVAVSLDGGRITAVSYATPTPTHHNGARIVLGLEHALFDLLHGIRGTPVSVTRLAGETIEGRVLGVETHPQGRENGSTLVLLVGEGTIRQIATGDISQLEMADGSTVREVGAYLDTVAGEEEGRALRITLDEPDRQVQVSYAAPSPVWRVSYRFVGNRDQSAALLQGWGIFDNLTGEDLEGVEVTLVAGQPVSFRYDLTSSVIPQRRFVQDEARIAAGPVEFAAALPSPVGPEERARASASYSADNAQIVRHQKRPFGLRSPQPSDLADATALEASTQDLTELFEYRLGEISVGRDESAMVPVVQRELPYHSELLYNAEKVNRHPVVSLLLRNDTGLTLERGPVTIVENGQYRGEAILPFTKSGAEVVLAYAVELGITATVDVDSVLSQEGLDIRGKLLYFQDDIIRTTQYSFVNSTNRDETVVLEQRK
ncbi:MAG: DUF4139 domain-containing protein, partial [Chloroflexota bacterium]|nr:DUF4139 domain-containing protein [Chloroflexota bacterium]